VNFFRKERKKKESEQNKMQELKEKVVKSTKTDKPDISDNQLLQSLLIQKKRKIALDPALFKRLMAEENEENKTLLEGLRKKRNKKTGKMELFWENNQDSNSSNSSGNSEYSETDSEEYVNEDEK
jgi:hypothetical protein